MRVCASEVVLAARDEVWLAERVGRWPGLGTPGLAGAQKRVRGALVASVGHVRAPPWTSCPYRLPRNPKRGFDVGVMREFAGHAGIRTTSIHTAVDERRLADRIAAVRQARDGGLVRLAATRRAS